jgi:hypothetical protein
VGREGGMEEERRLEEETMQQNLVEAKRAKWKNSFPSMKDFTNEWVTH